MTKLLEEAFTVASRLPDNEQDALASWVLEELESEQRWDESFARSQGMLEALAQSALAEHRAGRTRPLDTRQS